MVPRQYVLPSAASPHPASNVKHAINNMIKVPFMSITCEPGLPNVSLVYEETATYVTAVTSTKQPTQVRKNSFRVQQGCQFAMVEFGQQVGVLQHWLAALLLQRCGQLDCTCHD